MALNVRKAYSPRVAAMKWKILVHPVWLNERHRIGSAERWLRDPSHHGLYRVGVESCDHSPTMAALYRFYFDNPYTAVNFKLNWS